jgi:hypothetical protein
MSFIDFIHPTSVDPGYLLPGAPQATGSSHNVLSGSSFHFSNLSFKRPPLGTAAATSEICL